MGTSFFLAPDTNTPFGGVRKIYHFADVLNAVGRRLTEVGRGLVPDGAKRVA